MSSDPSCQPNCPEWLSLEGMITPGMAPAFADAISHLGGRRLPVLIHSHGGAVGDALAMGRLIRDRRLAVAVARTLISNCPENARSCPDARGQAITGGAACASACALILAGGVERLVGPVPLVGVHQITTVVKHVEGTAHLTSTRKFYEQGWADTRVMDYLTEMGVGDPVMTWLRKTPAASIHWLSLSDLSASHLATLALDATAPVVSGGANGLNGLALEGDPPRPDFVTAHVAAPLALHASGRSMIVEATFTYRRGGGVVEAVLATRDQDANETADSPAGGWSLTLTSGGGEPLQLKTAGLAPAGAIIPRERFCALVHGGKLVASPPDSAASATWANQPPVEFELAEAEGVRTLVEEACP